MGRWLEVLKKHENADEEHPQNPQKYDGGAAESASFPDAARDRGEVAGHGGGRNFKVPDGNVETVTAADVGLSRKEIHEVSQLDAPLPTVHRFEARTISIAHPNPVRAIMERLEGDMERYAEALRAYGPMSYGQAMQVLGWGATRAGCAESDLSAAGRIAFNQLGRAYLVDEEASHDE